MNPNKLYLKFKEEILHKIQLENLALPKRQAPEPSHFGYTFRKPHGAEFWVHNGTYFNLQRNIVYQLEEEGAIRILNEYRDEYGYDGACFTVEVSSKFKEIYARFEKGIKIVKKLETEGLWIQANFEGEEIHFFIGEKEDDGNHVHVIVGKTGEIRIDPKDKAPATLLKKVLSVTTKEGKEIKATLEFEET